MGPRAPSALNGNRNAPLASIRAIEFADVIWPGGSFGIASHHARCASPPVDVAEAAPGQCCLPTDELPVAQPHHPDLGGPRRPGPTQFPVYILKGEQEDVSGALPVSDRDGERTHKPIVRLATDELKVPEGSPAYLLRYDANLAVLFTNAGFAHVARSECWLDESAEPFTPHRLRLPYGRWVEPDGAIVLFSRDYKPLWRLRHGEKPEPVEPWLWIRHEGREEWLWTPRETPWRGPETLRKLEAVLTDAGVVELPPLAKALDFLFTPGVNTVGGAVRIMAENAGVSVV